MKLIKQDVDTGMRSIVVFHETYVEVQTLTQGRTVTERTRYDILKTTRRDLYDDYLKLGYVSESEL